MMSLFGRFKVSITTVASGVDFLGWVHFPYHKTLRTVTKRRMMKNLKREPVNKASVESYLGLLGYGDTHILQSRLKTIILAHDIADSKALW